MKDFYCIIIIMGSQVQGLPDLSGVDLTGVTITTTQNGTTTTTTTNTDNAANSVIDIYTDTSNKISTIFIILIIVAVIFVPILYYFMAKRVSKREPMCKLTQSTGAWWIIGMFTQFLPVTWLVSLFTDKCPPERKSKTA